MRTKRLHNTSEYKTSRILEGVLLKAGFRVHPELALSRVLDSSEDSLSRSERNTLNSASFDFVVYNQDSFPEFAVEFDGPDHQREEAKRGDARKNLLCFKAGLPLLRINDQFLTEYKKTSLLEHIVRRFVDWRNEWETVGEKYGNMDDPTIMWDLEHPFPASLEIAESLYSTHGVVSSHIDAELYATYTRLPKFLLFTHAGMSSEPVGSYHYTIKRSYELREFARETSDKYHSKRLHFLSVEVSYQWRLPTVYRKPLDPAPSEYVYGQELPGISMSELADHFCDFLALNQLRVWAQQNLNVVNPDGTS